MISDRMASTIIIIVCAIWSLAVIVDMIPTFAYEMSNEIHYIFGGIVGGAFGVRHRAAGAKIDKDEKPERGGEHRR